MTYNITFVRNQEHFFSKSIKELSKLCNHPTRDFENIRIKECVTGGQTFEVCVTGDRISVFARNESGLTKLAGFDMSTKQATFVTMPASHYQVCTALLQPYITEQFKERA